MNELMNLMGPSPKEYAQLVKNLLSNRLALDASNIKRLTRGVKKGEGGHIAFGGQAFPRSVASERMAHEIKRAYNSLAKPVQYPIVARSRNPLSGMLEFAVAKSRLADTLKLLNIQSPSARLDQTPPTQHRYGSSERALAPRWMFSDNYDRAAVRNTFHATFNPLRNRGVGEKTSARPIFFDTNWAYRSAGEAPSGFDFFAPVTEAQAKSMRKEDEERAEAERKRAEGIRNYNRDQMSDYDREVANLTERYGGASNPNAGKMADETLRNELLKELPSFFKNSKRSTKELHRIAGAFKSLNGFGAIGRIAKFGMNHPLLAAYSLATAAMATVDRSNAKVVDWQNARAVNGRANNKFAALANRAGIDDNGQIDRAWGKLLSRYGTEDTAMQVLQMGGNMLMSAAPGIERQKIAEALGFDEKTAAMAMDANGLFAGSRARTVEGHRNRLSIEKILGLSSDSTIWEAIDAAAYLIPGWQSKTARNRAKRPPTLFGMRPPSIDGVPGMGPDLVTQDNHTTSNTDSHNTSFYINNMNVTANDAESLGADIKSKSGTSGVSAVSATANGGF